MKRYTIPETKVIPLRGQYLLMGGSDVTKNGQHSPMGEGKSGEEKTDDGVIWGDAKRSIWADEEWQPVGTGW